MLTNRDLAELLSRHSVESDPSDQQRRALRHAARGAFLRPEEASELVAQGQPLTELRYVGPWLARAAGVRISIGSDPHAPHQLASIALGQAAALEAGISRDRVLDFMSRHALLAWTRDLDQRATAVM